MTTHAFDTIYTFDLTGQISFGSLPTSTLTRIFRNGSIISKFMEHHIPIWFPEFEFVDAHGYDLLHTPTQARWELKGFTPATGAKYQPSKMIGGGRQDAVSEQYRTSFQQLLRSHIALHDLNYIITDIVDFPTIRVIFKRGTDLLATWPMGHIRVSERDNLFKSPMLVTEA